jgi:hypothetical protein
MFQVLISFNMFQKGFDKVLICFKYSFDKLLIGFTMVLIWFNMPRMRAQIDPRIVPRNLKVAPCCRPETEPEVSRRLMVSDMACVVLKRAVRLLSSNHAKKQKL